MFLLTLTLSDDFFFGVPQQGPVDVSTPIKLPTVRRRVSDVGNDDDDDDNNNDNAIIKYMNDNDGENDGSNNNVITSTMRTWPVSDSGHATSPVCVSASIRTPSTIGCDFHDDMCGFTPTRTPSTPYMARDAVRGDDECAGSLTPAPLTADIASDSHDETVDFSLSMSPRTPYSRPSAPGLSPSSLTATPRTRNGQAHSSGPSPFKMMATTPRANRSHERDTGPSPILPLSPSKVISESVSDGRLIAAITTMIIDPTTPTRIKPTTTSVTSLHTPPSQAARGDDGAESDGVFIVVAAPVTPRTPRNAHHHGAEAVAHSVDSPAREHAGVNVDNSPNRSLGADNLPLTYAVIDPERTRALRDALVSHKVR
jgi:hypothetical protein